MSASACILGCQGLELTQDERAFFRDARPWGFILFARNVASLAQLRRLTDQLREAVQDEGALVFVDQDATAKGGKNTVVSPTWERVRLVKQNGVWLIDDMSAS